MVLNFVYISDVRSMAPITDDRSANGVWKRSIQVCNYKHQKARMGEFLSPVFISTEIIQEGVSTQNPRSSLDLMLKCINYRERTLHLISNL